MQDTFYSENTVDANGNPTGGRVEGNGLGITWQNGPLGRGANRKKPNGAFVETVIAAALQRLQFYQSGKFACRENAIAITHLEDALLRLNDRTAKREAASIEGTHEVEPTNQLKLPFETTGNLQAGWVAPQTTTGVPFPATVTSDHTTGGFVSETLTGGVLTNA